MVPGPKKVVLGDANALYSRVLRDYLVYASDEGAISIRWSAEILDEVVEHLVANRPTFTTEMLAAHRRTVVSLAGATDESTIAALRRVNAASTADLMTALLGAI